MQITVVIPAYNEEATLARTLRALTQAPDSGDDISVVVAANGCTDGTVAVARAFGVRVLDLPTPSKTAALNEADAVAPGFPRVYLDADIVATPTLVRALATAVARAGTLAAVPRREVDASHSPWAVRGYYSINSRLPVYTARLFGRGVIALSQAARERFDRFPEIIADDMFLDAIVSGPERAEIDHVVRVEAPRRFRDLVRRVARARAGNAEFWRWLQPDGPTPGVVVDPIYSPRRGSWLRDVALPSPRLWPAAACYLTVVALAEATRRRSGWTDRSGWGRPQVAPRRDG